jgi:hypothetical protein
MHKILILFFKFFFALRAGGRDCCQSLPVLAFKEHLKNPYGNIRRNAALAAGLLIIA